MNIRSCLAVMLVLFAAACAEPATTIAPGGSMDVLGPVPAMEPSPLPDDWITQGAPQPGQLTVSDLDGVPALKVANGANGFLAVKPSRASLLATPYLSWAWNMDPQDDGPHPVRLVVGFHGGNPGARSWTGAFTPSGGALPPLDRALNIVWGLSALERGSIITPSTVKGKQAAARYVQRGGQENTKSWWFETVDLSDIYRRVWPNDDIGAVQITFIGIAAAPGRAPTSGYVSGIRLSR